MGNVKYKKKKKERKKKEIEFENVYEIFKF